MIPFEVFVDMLLCVVSMKVLMKEVPIDMERFICSLGISVIVFFFFNVHQCVPFIYQVIHLILTTQNTDMS